ncbi:hypothetical protein EHS25_003867 [Saitozyma podzolica]|uniref:Uncharacterized protein n=1 Tax=Saitozyma podzolica TaxID=1890683 RepID=A0A427Y3R4_9TREE|nr:hypothetical protein EHS25_003867 [Saitozyma podzolica]
MSALGASTHDGARDVDFVARLGPFPQWLDKLKQPRPRAPDPTPLNYTTIFRDGWPDDDPRAPGPSKGQDTFGYSYLAQEGAASLLGCRRPKFDFEELKIIAESGVDYAIGKLLTFKNQPEALLQAFRDEYEYIFSNTSVAQGAEEDDFGLDPNGDNRLGIVLRVLKSAVWQYVLWSEIKECVDRLEKLGMARMSWPNQDQWSRHPQIKKEYESLWVMENMLSMETRYNLRTTYAGGPGRDLLERYITKPGKNDLQHDLRFRLKDDFEHLHQTRPFDAAFAGVCLHNLDMPKNYSNSRLVNLLAFEQLASSSEENARRVPSYLHMLLGEWAMSSELGREIPLAYAEHVKLSDLPLQASNPANLPKTFRDRATICTAAMTGIAEAFEGDMFSDDFSDEEDSDAAGMIWYTVEILIENAATTRGLRLKSLMNFVGDDAGIPTPTWKVVKDGKRVNVAGKKNHPVFKVDAGKLKLVTRIFSGGMSTAPWLDLIQLLRSIGFRVDYLGGAAIRFVPPGHAGPATILRIPPPSVWHENLPAGMLGGLGEEFNGQWGWTPEWFKRSTDGDADPEWEDI